MCTPPHPTSQQGELATYSISGQKPPPDWLWDRARWHFGTMATLFLYSFRIRHRCCHPKWQITLKCSHIHVTTHLFNTLGYRSQHEQHFTLLPMNTNFSCTTTEILKFKRLNILKFRILHRFWLIFVPMDWWRKSNKVKMFGGWIIAKFRLFINFRCKASSPKIYWRRTFPDVWYLCVHLTLTNILTNHQPKMIGRFIKRFRNWWLQNPGKQVIDCSPYMHVSYIHRHSFNR